MQRIRPLGASLVVAFAVSLIASATASAVEEPLLLPEPTKAAPLNFTSEGPAAEILLSASGISLKCKAVSTKGSFTGPREGTLTLTFTGCTFFTKNCNTPGAAAGEVVLTKSEIHLVDFKEGMTALILGAVITLPATISIKCGEQSFEVLGNVLGRINGIEPKVPFEKATLLFVVASKKQALKTCEFPAAFCKERTFLLEANFGGGLGEAALENENKLKFAKKVEALF